MDNDAIDKLVHDIADELLTLNYGSKNQMVGTRLATMQGIWPNERELGGRNRRSIEAVLKRHIIQAIRATR